MTLLTTNESTETCRVCGESAGEMGYCSACWNEELLMRVEETAWQDAWEANQEAYDQ